MNTHPGAGGEEEVTLETKGKLENIKVMLVV